MSSSIIIRKDKLNQNETLQRNLIIPPDLLNGDCTIPYGDQQSGLRLQFTVVNGKEEGLGQILRKDDSIYMTVNYVNGVKEGEVVKYNEKGSVIMRGNMKNGEEVGLYREFDDNGELVWLGHYKDGKRYSELKKSDKKEGYYEERTMDGSVLSVSKYDEERMEKDGISYEFKNGKLEHVYEYSKGRVTRVLMELKGKEMCEYDENGRKRYEGGYGGSVESGIVREGVGKEYDEKEAAIYVGGWHEGKRNGYGTEYENGVGKYNGMWKDGKMDKGMDGKRELPIVESSNSSVPVWLRKLRSMKYGGWIMWGSIGVVILLIIIIWVMISMNESNGTRLKKCKDLTSYPSKKVESVTRLIFVSGFECEEIVDVSRFVKCESIEIESNAMNGVNQLDMSKLVSLKSLSIGENSCGKVNEVIVEDTIYNELTSVTIGSNSLNSLEILIGDAFPSLTSVNIGSNSLNSLTSLPTSTNRIRSIVIGSSSLNKIPEFPLKEMSSLRSMKVGSNSFGSLREMELSGMNQLSRLEVMEGSFSGVSSLRVLESNWRVLSGFGFHEDSIGYGLLMNGESPIRNVKNVLFEANLTVNAYRFEIDGMERLESIQVEANSFDGGGEMESLFRVENCPSLRSVLIYQNNFVNYKTIRFVNLTNEIAMSMHQSVFMNSDRMEFVNVGFTNFIIGESSYKKMRRIVLEGMEMLKSVKIGSKSFSDEANGHKEGLFRVANCPILSSIEIENYAFDDYTELEVVNNPSLVVLTMGDWSFGTARSISLISKEWMVMNNRFTETGNDLSGTLFLYG